MNKELTEQRNNCCRTAEGINAYRVNSRTDNDVTYLGSVLKMNFAKPKFCDLFHICEIRENFVPQKFPLYSIIVHNMYVHTHIQL